MHFDYTEEHEMLRDAARGYLERTDPVKLIRARDNREARRAAWKGAAEQGWAALLGLEPGAVVTVVEAMVVGEELGRAAFTGPFMSSNVAALTIAACGTAAQRSELLGAIADGSLLATWGGYSPDKGWGALAVLAAVRDASGIIINGELGLVQDADIADYILVTAQLDGTAIQLLVPADAPGVAVRVSKQIDVSRQLCEVSFAGVVVPEALTLAVTADILAEQSRIASVLTSADSVGLAARLLDMTLAYTKERVAFGKPIASFQAIKHRVADMLVNVETARVAVWHAAVRTRDGTPERDEAASIAKFYATTAASHVAAEALQLHGGIGFTWEHDLHLFLKRGKANEMTWGTNAWHRERVAQIIGI